MDGSAGDLQKFGVLRSVERIWAIAAVRGDVDKLTTVHQQIADAFQPGDGVVYLGDIIGFGDNVTATIDEVLRFRCAVMALPPLRFADEFGPTAPSGARGAGRSGPLEPKYQTTNRFLSGP